MRAVFGLVLLIGMGLAGFAVYMVKGYFDDQAAVLQQERQRSASAVATVDVYAPTRPLTYGEEIRPEDIQLIKYAVDFLPEGVFQTEEELFPEGLGKLRIVKRPIEVNEPILAVKVTEPGASRGIAALLDRGMRPFPVPDNVSAAFGSELRPTDRVDIFWSGTARGAEITRLIKSNLEVIAVDEPDANGNGGGRGVVLQVTPEDFAALAQAQNSGRVYLSVVGTGDTTVLGEIQTNLDDVLNIEEEVAAPAPAPVIAPKECFVFQGRGTERVKVIIECQD